MTLFDYKIQLSVLPAGYGHWLITYRCGNGCTYEGVTNNSMLIDAFKEENECTIAVCREMARIARLGKKLNY